MCSKYHFLSQDELSVPYWHVELIEERLADFEKNGMKGIPWEDVEKELFDLLNDD
ncbi:MAG TPA: addiction module protein [Pyrinomonadaceae bacterium]|jgi:hypothetical protein|nr:addiction module protein [Pyrinomonadaceae bacterium]